MGIERDHDAAAHWIDRSVRAGDADLAGIAREFAHDSFRLIGVLNVGLDLGLLSPALFSMMVIMALVTTVITTPLLNVVLPEEYRRTALKAS